MPVRLGRESSVTPPTPGPASTRPVFDPLNLRGGTAPQHHHRHLSKFLRLPKLPPIFPKPNRNKIATDRINPAGNKEHLVMPLSYAPQARDIFFCIKRSPVCFYNPCVAVITVVFWIETNYWQVPMIVSFKRQYLAMGIYQHKAVHSR